MVDIGLIGTALNSLKAAMDIAKFLRESNLSLEKAELKWKLAELTSALADAKIQFVQVQDELQEKDKRIAELEEAFETKDELVRQYDAYYAVNSAGKPIGVPYCLHCWENGHKKRQLVYHAEDRFKKICTTCGNEYTGRLTNEIRESS